MNSPKTIEQKLLRLQDEPCKHFTEKQIHAALMKHTKLYMNQLERLYLLYKSKKSIVDYPRKNVFTTPGLKGDFRVMPCVIGGFDRSPIKAVKVIGTNEEQRTVKDKISVGKALLLHPKDNYVEGIFDVCAFSSFRTAAISVLALKHLTFEKNMSVGLIGAGRIGYYTANLLYDWLGIKNFYVTDINKNRMKLFKQAFRNKKGCHIQTMNFNETCRSAQALFLATDSRKALVNAHNTQTVQFISSVGADAENLSELHKNTIKGSRLVTDSLDNIYFGDMNRWRKAGALKKNIVEELRPLIGKKKKNNKKIIFISTGTAVQDAFSCRFLFKHIK